MTNERHLIKVCLEPSFGVEFLCSCGKILDDAQAGLHHVLYPDDATTRGWLLAPKENE